MKRLLGWFDDFLQIVGRMNSTATRIGATLVIAFGTAVRYWTSETWKPSWEWLLFIMAMAGIDALQYHSKRSTFKTPKEMEQ